MATETCENCKRIIGELEQAYTWHSHILCKECYARLSNPTAKQPIPVDVHTPIIQPTPQRSLVKSTLIVMATVIAVIVVIYIILSMPSILSQCSRQITIYKANNGDASAQFLRGLMYQFGDGVPRDYKKAVKWYTKAAEQGNVIAQFQLGEMYSIGSDFYEGVPRDDKEAVKWYTKAAEQGYAHAQYSLGIMYQSKDYKEAFKWFTKAAEQGDASAQFALGEMYYKSQDVVENHIEAYKWFLLAEVNGKEGTLKEEISYRMTPAQIAEAQKRAKEFTEKQEKEKTEKNTKTSGVK